MLHVGKWTYGGRTRYYFYEFITKDKLKITNTCSSMYKYSNVLTRKKNGDFTLLKCKGKTAKRFIFNHEIIDELLKINSEYRVWRDIEKQSKICCPFEWIEEQMRSHVKDLYVSSCREIWSYHQKYISKK